MAEETTNSTPSASVDKISQMAQILMGEDEAPAKPKPKAAAKKQDDEEGSTQSKSSNDEGESEDKGEYGELDLDLTDEGEENGEEENEETDAEEEELSWGKVLGIDESKIALSDDGEILGINVKIDGKIDTVPVNELIAGYQTNKSNTNKAQTLAAERKQFEEARQFVAMDYQKKLEDAQKLTDYLEGNLLREFQGVDWEQLRYSNPAEYAAMVQDFKMRQSEIERVKVAVNSERTAEQQKLQGQSQAQMNEYLQTQVEKVIEKNPTWAKPEVFKKALGEFETFIEEAYGFSKGDFANIQDARIFEVLKDAKAYREGKKIADKKVNKTVPKFQKPSGAPARKKSKLEILTQQARNAKNTSAKRDLQTSAIAELLLNGG
jgi:hypothetical protein